MATILVSAGPGLKNESKGLPKTEGFLIISAIRELVSQVANTKHKLVFGDHPSVTVVVKPLMEAFNIDPSRYEIFGSEFYSNGDLATRFIVAGKDEETSRRWVIESMMREESFDAQIVLGGGNSISSEYAAFTEAFPDKPVLKIGSTGGFAQILNNDASIDYVTMFNQFLGELKLAEKEEKSIQLKLNSPDDEPDEYGLYSVLVQNAKGGHTLVNAVYTHPPGFMQQGWFFTKETGAYDHHYFDNDYVPIVDKILYWVQTHNIELAPDLKTAEPQKRKL